MTSFGDSYRVAMISAVHQGAPKSMRPGSKADASARNSACVARQLSDVGTQNMDICVEHFSACSWQPARGSSSSPDFSKTLPAGTACDTPRLHSSIQEPISRDSYETALSMQQREDFVAKSVEFTEDCSFQQMHIYHGSQTAMFNQHVGGATAFLPSSSSCAYTPHKSSASPRRASCRVLPDRQYQQRLQQLMEAEQHLQAQLRDKQQLLVNQLQLQQQLGAASAPRQRRASYSINSHTDHLLQAVERQQQQQGGEARASRAFPARRSLDMSSMCSTTSIAGRSPVDMHHMSDMCGMGVPSCADRRAPHGAHVPHARSGSSSASTDFRQSSLDKRDLPPQLQVLLLQQQQQLGAVGGHARKQRRSSCCVGPDRQYWQQLQYLQQQLDLEELQREQEQQLQARQWQRKQHTTAAAPRRRRASYCVMPSEISHQQGTVHDALLLHSREKQPLPPLSHFAAGGEAAVLAHQFSIPPRRDLNPALFKPSCKSSARLASEAEDYKVPPTAAAAGYPQQHDGVELRSTNRATAGWEAADRSMSYIGSRCSSISSGSAFGSLSMEVGLSRGLSWDFPMDAPIAGIVAAAAAASAQQQPGLLQRSISISSSSSSSSSKQASHQPAHAAMELFRQTSISSYASDDTMETIGSGGPSLQGLSGSGLKIASDSVGPATLSGLCQPGPGTTNYIGLTKAGVPPVASSTDQGSAVTAAVLTAAVPYDPPAKPPAKGQASLHDSLELIHNELKHLRDLKASLARAAAAAPAGSPVAAACVTAQARNSKTIKWAVAAKAALEAATAGALDIIAEMDQDGSVA